jgi:hypothetical protein
MAGNNNTTGSFNTISGYYSGYTNNSGRYNSMYGAFAGRFNSSGYYNSFFGYASGYLNSTGYYNVTLGYLSGRNNTTGHRNTNLGTYAGYSNSTGSGNVFIGYQAGYYETGSNQLYITNNSDTTPLIHGDFANDVVTINGSINIVGTASAEEIEVKLMSSNSITSDNIKTENLNVAIDDVADYVFGDDYDLRSLKEVETFVKSNKHLPGIPSGKELQQEGMDVAKMNNLLLEKIEELTLYIIEQDKRIKKLENAKSK